MQVHTVGNPSLTADVLRTNCGLTGRTCWGQQVGQHFVTAHLECGAGASTPNRDLDRPQTKWAIVESILPDAGVTEDIKAEIVAIAVEDLRARTDALKGTMPDRMRRHVIAWQSVEIMRALIRRHLPDDRE